MSAPFHQARRRSFFQAREMARTVDASSGTRGAASGKGASMSLNSARQAGHVFRCASTAARLAWEQAPSW